MDPNSPKGVKVQYDWELYKVVGRNIRRLREALGMSGSEFVQHVTLKSRQAYSYIEQGRVRISVEDLYRIIKTFGISFDYLFKGYRMPEEREFDKMREERNAAIEKMSRPPRGTP
jgi:transcriptional regulator with XRE-family HTH domain